MDKIEQSFINGFIKAAGWSTSGQGEGIEELMRLLKGGRMRVKPSLAAQAKFKPGFPNPANPVNKPLGRIEYLQGGKPTPPPEIDTLQEELDRMMGEGGVGSQTVPRGGDPAAGRLNLPKILASMKNRLSGHAGKAKAWAQENPLKAMAAGGAAAGVGGFGVAGASNLAGRASTLMEPGVHAMIPKADPQAAVAKYFDNPMEDKMHSAFGSALHGMAQHPILTGGTAAGLGGLAYYLQNHKQKPEEPNLDNQPGGPEELT